ncbi:TRAP transporter large permease [Amorphus orientalis]|uniref:TRAP transporter large permease protein n=1 Tax=Amorphus orientalis TaxID=649198 RepID=A0AAE3VNB8_9HYPH|nr:TRAP transporter large permease [Amorphus orientalis]MDQ0315196.1 tripartite ATP-independent transporter DctM subunit [Amorphus orientalis]
MNGNLLLLLGVFAGLAVLRIPVGLAMMASGIAYLFWTDQDIGLLVDQVGGRLYASYTLIAIPMFIFAANVMNAGTITDRIVRVAAFLFGRLPGGVAHANVASSVVFSGMSGSAVADVAGPGRVMMEMMTRDGRYTPGFAGAVTAASATIGPIIPPSIPVVLYAVVSNASVGALFLGGIVPGVMMALALMAVITVLARRRGMKADPAAPLSAIGRAFLDAGLPLLMPVILLGGIYLGVTTATEAASVAALYALVLAGFVYRTLSWRGLYTILADTVRESAIVSITIAGAFIVNYAIANERFPDALAAWVLDLDLPPLAFLIVVNVLFLLLGCLLDVSVMLLVLVPLLVPAVVYSGIDLVHFGIVIIVNIMIGLATPPYGMLLFVIASVTGTDLKDIVREIWPFIGVLVAVLFLLVVFPGLVLWLPGLLGF